MHTGKSRETNQSQENYVHSAFVCQFYTVSNPHSTHLLTIHCCVCVFEVIWPFYYKEPWFRVGGSFTILASESWKQSTSFAHKEESTSLSAWKHNTGAEQSIVAYCLRSRVLSWRLLSEPEGIARHLTCHLASGKFTHTCWHRCWCIYTDGDRAKHNVNRYRLKQYIFKPISWG